MHCTDTGHQPAIRLEHLSVRSTRRLNKLIGILKAGFNGNGQLTLVMSGGHVDDIKLAATDPNIEKKAS